MLKNLITRKKLTLGLISALLVIIGLSGYAIAVVMTKTASSKVLTMVTSIGYKDVLNAPSDGSGGYLVDMSSFPINARITSTDIYVNTPFATNEQPGSQADAFGTVNLTANGYPSNDLAQGDLNNGNTSGYIYQNGTSAIDPIVSSKGELKMDVVNEANNGSSLSNLVQGQITVYINYIQYPSP